jgi:hypothetical protein
VGEATIDPIFNCFVNDATEASRTVAIVKFTIGKWGLIAVTERAQQSDRLEVRVAPQPSNVPE